MINVALLAKKETVDHRGGRRSSATALHGDSLCATLTSRRRAAVSSSGVLSAPYRAGAGQSNAQGSGGAGPSAHRHLFSRGAARAGVSVVMHAYCARSPGMLFAALWGIIKNNVLFEIIVFL